MSAKCLRRPDGSVDYFVGLVQDITERKQAEQSLREAHQRAEMILDSISDRFFSFDKEWRFTHFNQQAREYLKSLGRDPDKLIGKVYFDEFPVRYAEAAMRRAMSERVPVVHEFYFPPLQQWVEGRIYPSPDGGIGVYQRDISERKLAEEKLRRSEAYLAEGQRLSHTASWAWNVSTGEVYWSAELFSIYGLDPARVKPGYPEVLSYIHPGDRSWVQRIFEDAVQERKEYQLVYRVVWSDGTIRHVHNLAHPVFNEAGTLMEYVGTTIDITERIQAEENLRRSEAHLAEAQTELAHVTRVMTLGELTASIAHEVNQPLGAIVTNGHACLRLLSDEGGNLEQAREAVECMISDGIRASEVIKRIRALLRKTPTGRSSHNLNNTIREVIDLSSRELEKKEVYLVTELAEDLPLVVADRVQVQQVVLNLILNSNEAMMAAGWQPRELLIKSDKGQRNEVLITVRDTGVGLDPITRERMFDPFFTSKERGLGLGLSISRTIIEAHGGRLWATSNQEGPGTTFQFTLPAGD